MNYFFYIAGGILLLFSLVPMIRKNHWYIRAFDFPRLQVFYLLLVLAVTYLLLPNITQWNYWYLLVLAIAMVALLYRIVPYTPFAPVQTKRVTEKATKPQDVRLMVYNVLMYNKEYESTLDLIKKVDPDILVLVETGEEWERAMQPLRSYFNHFLGCPLNNTYGMLFYSKLKIKNSDIRFLVQEDIPSIHVDFYLRSGHLVRFHAIHPKPPAPQEAKTSTPRDTELLLLGREIAEKEFPIIVAGDLNDVAWSYTSRLFRKISGLQDPRIGRGMFSTFHAKNLMMRWPLDHIFHTKEFLLKKIERLPTTGSDHFPMLMELRYSVSEDEDNPGQHASDEEIEEASEILEENEKELGYEVQDPNILPQRPDNDKP